MGLLPGFVLRGGWWHGFCKQRKPFQVSIQEVLRSAKVLMICHAGKEDCRMSEKSGMHGMEGEKQWVWIGSTYLQEEA